MINFASFQIPGIFKNSEKKVLLLLCAFWLLIALLEFAQDYISSTLNYGTFILSESLAYKIYWLIFIPLTLALVTYLNKFAVKSAGYIKFISAGAFVIIISIIHLVIFSFMLLGISAFIHNNPWELSFLLIQKFSTRLYISLVGYTILAGVYFWVQHKDALFQSSQQKSITTITVKNGRRSVVIDTDKIKWISSDGPYLYIHTPEKKHIVTESLKHIITRLPENFKRIHRSSIVNIDMIKELKSRLNGDYDVILKDGDILRLSRNYSGALKGILL